VIEHTYKDILCPGKQDVLIVQAFDDHFGLVSIQGETIHECIYDSISFMKKRGVEYYEVYLNGKLMCLKEENFGNDKNSQLGFKFIYFGIITPPNVSRQY